MYHDIRRQGTGPGKLWARLPRCVPIVNILHPSAWQLMLSQYYELLSPQDCDAARAECTRTLMGAGAIVQVENAEHWACLKVHASSIRGKSIPPLQPDVKTGREDRLTCTQM